MKNQKGSALIFTIFFVVVISLICGVVIRSMRDASINLIRSSNSDSLRQVTAAAQAYANQNRESLLKDKRINGFMNPNEPTVSELQAQRYLTLDGVDITAPYGSSYKIVVSPNQNGSIGGFVYLAGNVLDSSGRPDTEKACAIARNMGDIGFCSSKANSSLIGNGTINLRNPTGQNVATIAGFIFVAS